MASLVAGPASAGLVLEIDAGIDVRTVQSVQVENGSLVFHQRSGSFTVRLPPNLLAMTVQWASHYEGGPVVISMDGSLVSRGRSYTPPDMPGGLAVLMFGYDSYAHAVACGATPQGQTQQHPLVSLKGSEAFLPYRLHQALLDGSNTSSEAIWYRRLTARYTAPPACIGELTLKVGPGVAPTLVSTRVNSWVHSLPQHWYRRQDVPSEWDSWAARLPYKPLKLDLEERWERYRAAFPSLDELSSVAEALALLHALRVQSPEVWNQLTRSSRQSPPSGRHGPAYVELSTHSFDSSSWMAVSKDWIGSTVDTPAEANLALELLLHNPRFGAGLERAWVEGIEAVAQRDPRTRAKLYLARLEESAASGSPVDPGEVDALLVTLHEDFPDAFRLRAEALQFLRANIRSSALDDDDDDEDEDEEVGEESEGEAGVDQRLRLEEERLLQDFVSRVRPHCGTGVPESRDDDNYWEDRSRDVYSTDLMPLIAGATAELKDEALRAIACIHFRRGLTFQVGRELAYRHAHFRFLGYLATQMWNPSDRALVHSYRKELAQSMGLTNWERGEQEEDDESISEVDSSPVDRLRTDLAPSTIEGTLWAAECMAASQVTPTCNRLALLEAKPAGLLTQKGYVVLLVDSRLLLRACPARTGQGRLRAGGVLHAGAGAFTVFHLEEDCGAGWKVVDLPYSGVAGAGTEGGDE